MANVCDNRCYIYSENTELLNIISEEIINQIDDYLDIWNSDENYIECSFSSKWLFPISEMETITNKLKKDYNLEDLKIRVLSEELGCNYIALNRFENQEWLEEQTFDF